jgi:hypothetical protein
MLHTNWGGEELGVSEEPVVTSDRSMDADPELNGIDIRFQ